ncbi:Alkaline phosphatase [hydrothermal vent metagenome]|uniref:Alkaline phosphatase n=1 Tax=hydrothermal vent metagenome TaxID=652676 RepID=A0A3B0UKS1_9ZZZZ
MRTTIYILFIGCTLALSGCNHEVFNEVLLRDNFNGLDTGLFSSPTGAHSEYHYFPEAGIKGNWAVSSFFYGLGLGWGTAWQVKKDGQENMMCQTFLNDSIKATHPMICAGDSLWRNYKLTVRFSTDDALQYSGIAFRYRNDRCFYFFGVKDSIAYISIFNHANSIETLNEKILAEQPFSIVRGQDMTAIVTVEGNSIKAKLNNDVNLNVIDDTYPSGKIGLVSNARAQYKFVEVLTTRDEKEYFESKKSYYEQETLKLQAKNPGMVLWKKIKTEGFGVGRNLRFGDLNNDGQIDVLIGQVIHHKPRDTHSELSCLTAMTFDGKILWQTGVPDPEKNHLTNDVGFQIYDIDRDGKNEVIYCMNFKIIVADGATGEIKYSAPTPKTKIDNYKFPQILGDCLFFFDAEGNGYDGNILIKDRYSNFWVMNSKLDIIWEGSCKTGHYPYAADIDNDGKDELAIGYSLYDDDGKVLWCLDDKIEDHADGVSIVNFEGKKYSEPLIMYAASNDGYLLVDLKGNILRHYFIGHVQNPAIANFRADMPGLETVTINFWGNQGIIHLFDASGNIYNDFEPNQFGSMCLPLNWTGTGEEYFVHNPSIKEGGVFDGWARKVLVFPDDGHPDMCNAVLDITGDCRDEIVVWDPNEIWVYTQNDNPKKGKLYKPIRNPLYNYSNYQTTVSLPGWNDN